MKGPSAMTAQVPHLYQHQPSPEGFPGTASSYPNTMPDPFEGKKDPRERKNVILGIVGAGLAVSIVAGGGAVAYEMHQANAITRDLADEDNANLMPGQAMITTEQNTAGVRTLEDEINRSTFPGLVRTLKADMPAAYAYMDDYLSSGEQKFAYLDMPSDFGSFTPQDALSYMAIGEFTASIEGEDGKIIPSQGREILSTVIAKSNPNYDVVAGNIDGKNGLIDIFESTGPAYPKLTPGTSFLNHTIGEDGGMVVKMRNARTGRETVGLFEEIEVDGQDTLVSLDNYNLDKPTIDALASLSNGS